MGDATENGDTDPLGEPLEEPAEAFPLQEEIDLFEQKRHILNYFVSCLLTKAFLNARPEVALTLFMSIAFNPIYVDDLWIGASLIRLTNPKLNSIQAFRGGAIPAQFDGYSAEKFAAIGRIIRRIINGSLDDPIIKDKKVLDDLILEVGGTPTER